MAKNLQDKIKAILAEGSGVPGTDAILGTKQSEELKGSTEDVDGAADNAKMTGKYNKTTKQEKLDDPAEGKGEVDPKAAEETKKIKGNLTGGSQEKLKEEAFNALFSGESLSEEFQTKAKAIFEATVDSIAEAKVEALEEEYQQQLDEAVNEVKGELVEQIDGYLDYVVEQWMQDNALALESGIKLEIMENFMENLKDVFEAHYIDVPESKVDLVEEQAQEIENLKNQIDEANELAEQASIEARILRAEAILAEASTGLTAMQAEKLNSLAENIEFDTDEEFKEKVEVLKESFFNQSIQNKPTQEAPQLKETKHSEVDAVLNALHQNLKLIRSSN